MAIVGIICEYNPLHRGHTAQMESIRARLGQDTVIVCCMSGNFVQRGEPAVFPKSVRAAAAIECGADLVLELPVTGCLQSAEGFAACGVEILSAIGCEYLCFGCESGAEAPLMELAAAMEEEAYRQRLLQKLAEGRSYAAARQQAALELGLHGELLRQPNDILALEYCRQLLLQKSRMQPLAIRRAGGYHDETPDAQNPSATSLRLLLEKKERISPYVPAGAAALYEAAPRFFFACGQRAMLARLRTMEPEDWETTAHGSEGLWSKALRASRDCTTIEQMVDYIKSKRYARTRIVRLLLCAYLGISEALLRTPVSYVRILGFSAAGQALLHEKKKNCPILLINAGAPAPAGEFASLERRCDALYLLFAANDADMTTPEGKNCGIYRKIS